jgi:hypothetical protein
MRPQAGTMLAAATRDNAGGRNERLTFASRSWGPAGSDPTSAHLARTLRDAIANLTSHGHSMCAVSVKSTTTEGFPSALRLWSPRLDVFAPHAGSFVAAGINETISEPAR